MNEAEVMCQFCNKKYCNTSSLKRHIEKIHGIKTRNLVLGEDIIRNDCDIMRFQHITEFYKWKEEMEKETCSFYVKLRGLIQRKGGVVDIYYGCCRSGNYKPKGKNLKKRSQQSMKLNDKCSARITVKVKEDEIIVYHYKIHDKHSLQEEQLKRRVPKDLRALIAEKLLSGIPVQRIYDDIQDSNTTANSNSSEVDGAVHISKRDIYNIKRDLKNGTKNLMDSVNMNLWMDEMETEGAENPMCYEEQEEDISEMLEMKYFSHAESQALNDDEYIIGETEAPNPDESKTVADSLSQVQEPSSSNKTCPSLKALRFVGRYKRKKHNFTEEEQDKIHTMLDCLLSIVSSKASSGGFQVKMHSESEKQSFSIESKSEKKQVLNEPKLEEEQFISDSLNPNEKLDVHKDFDHIY